MSEKDLSTLVEGLDKTASPEKLLELLTKISIEGNKIALAYLSEQKYLDQEKAYRVISKAYRTALDLIGKDPQFATLRTFSSSFSDTARVWDQKADLCIMFSGNDAIKARNTAYTMYSNGHYKDAIELFLKALQLGYSDRVDIDLGLGNCYLANKEYSTALRYYEDAISLDPKNSNGWYLKGISYYQLQDYANALQCYNRAISLAPTRSEFLLARGDLFRKRGEPKNAIDSYDEALANDTTNDNLWLKRGLALHELGNYAGAAECYDKVLELNPFRRRANLLLAEVLFLQGRNDESVAIASEIWRSSDRDNNYKLAAGFMIASSLFLQGRMDEGLEVSSHVLSYCESMLTGCEFNWDFKSLQPFIATSNLGEKEKGILLSFVGLALTKDEVEKRRKMKDLKEMLLGNTSTDHARGMPSGTPSSRLEIELDNTATPDEKEEGWYFWEVFLIASDSVLTQIQKVQYILDPSFRNPIRVIEDPIGGFRLKGKGWGEFDLKAQIFMKSGEMVLRAYRLKLRNESKTS